MSRNRKKVILGREVLFNHFGQIVFKKRFLSRFTTQFYRFILGGS